MYYAEINAENICTGVSVLTGEVSKAHLIPLVGFDVSLIGRKYNNGIWEEVPKEEPGDAEEETATLSEQEEIALDTALNVEYMVCLMEESLGLE